jgi:hypothetical protein
MLGTVTPGRREDGEISAKPADRGSAATGSLLWTWLSATAVIAGVEWLLLSAESSLVPTRQSVRLLGLGFGQWLAYALASVVALRCAGLAVRWLERWLSHAKARWVVAAVAALLASPYALGLARFTFSGPRARVMAHHGLLVAVAAVGVSSLLGLAVWLSGLTFRAPWLRRTWVALLVLGVVGVAWLSRAVMPSEYEPLHTFLALLALAGAGLAGTALGREIRVWSIRSELVGMGALAATALLAEYRLARSEDDSWIVWSRTACSRYLTDRWSFLAESEADDAVSGLISKPSLDTEQTLHWRQERAAAPAPNIVIFSIDGLVPEHIGAYGYRARRTTPNIDRMARRGVRFTRAFSTYPATKQFNSSLLLGRLVPESGASRAPEAFREKAITRLLHERGYHTFVQSWFESTSSHRFDPKYFQIDTNVKKAAKKNVLELPMAERMVAIEQHIREAEQRKQPIFMWMHLLGTHPVNHNFVPHPDFSWGDSRTDRYDSAIAGSDLWLAELEKLMAAHADPQRGTIWVICSDHGVRVESAGRDLYASIVHVPLIIVGPGFEARTLEAPVETAVDLAASVLDFAGIAPPDSYDGISLVPLLIRGDVGSRMDNRVIPLMRGSWRGAVNGPYKLMRYKDSFSFFDSRTDPSEEHNVYSQNKARARQIWKTADAELRRRIAAFRGTSEELAANETGEQENDDD